MKDKHKDTIVIKNRRCHFDYELIEQEVAGISLVGSEVKSIRSGNASIGEAHCYIQDGECFITGMYIAEYKESGRSGHKDTYGTRRLLLTKKQIRRWDKAIKTKGITIVPVKLFISNGKIKINIALARGKRNYDKRLSIKERDIQRDTNRIIKE